MNNCAGQFACENDGIILDCCSDALIRRKKDKGFAASGDGTQIRCATNTRRAVREVTIRVSAADLEIGSREELLEAVRRINSGAEDSSRPRIALTRDIDLKGAALEPIGTPASPFSGVLDGRGHTLSNCKIRADEPALFGVISKSGTVCNLRVQSIQIRGKKTAAAFVHENHGHVSDCSVEDADIFTSRNAGGFVFKNMGELAACSISGRIRGRRNAIPLLVLLLVLLALLRLIWQGKQPDIRQYPPIDAGQRAIGGEPPAQLTGGYSAAFSFSRTVAVDNGKAVFEFQNPAGSQSSIQIILQITDAELIARIGRTGRSELEQTELQQSGYDPARSRITLAESGLVTPGHELTSLNLHPLPDGTELPEGDYSAVILMQFYDAGTNQPALVNAQIPVTLLAG